MLTTFSIFVLHLMNKFSNFFQLQRGRYLLLNTTYADQSGFVRVLS